MAWIAEGMRSYDKGIERIPIPEEEDWYRGYVKMRLISEVQRDRYSRVWAVDEDTGERMDVRCVSRMWDTPREAREYIRAIVRTVCDREIVDVWQEATDIINALDPDTVRELGISIERAWAYEDTRDGLIHVAYDDLLDSVCRYICDERRRKERA